MDRICVARLVGQTGPHAVNTLWTRGIAHAYIAVTNSLNGNE